VEDLKVRLAREVKHGQVVAEQFSFLGGTW
jgi:hypothetical protein